MKQYKRFYEEGGVMKEDGTFRAEGRTEALRHVAQYNKRYPGWRSYYFAEIKEAPAQRPIIKRTVAA